MDYEKKYKDALAHAREIHRNEDGKRKDMEFLFPELKGIDDEEIKEEIINYFECQSKEKPTRKDIYNKWIAWLKKQDEHKKQVHFPKFTFDDVLALQCCMETVKKVQEDKELYKQLNLIHNKMYDTYWLEKQSNKPQGKTYTFEGKSVLEAISEEKVDNANKFKPKFKVGDWIANNACIFKISSIKDGFYWTDNDCVGGDIESIDKEYHLANET